MIAFVLSLFEAEIRPVNQGSKIEYTVNSKQAESWVNNYDMFKVDISDNNGANGSSYEFILNYHATRNLTVYVCKQNNVDECLKGSDKKIIEGQTSYYRMKDIRSALHADDYVYLVFTTTYREVVTVEF